MTKDDAVFYGTVAGAAACGSLLSIGAYKLFRFIFKPKQHTSKS